jgi:1-acyl-sn-glycerol-3-phosphate acyltransferase
MHAIGRHLRAAARLAAISALTAVLWLMWLAAPRSLRWRYRLMRAWARGIARIAGLEIDVAGEPPRRPFLLVTNHLSYVDIIVLSSIVECSYVSRGDIRDWPVVGLLCRSMGVIFVDRSRRADVQRVSNEMRARLERGEGVVFFPEGTSTAGDRILPFRPSLFDAAVQAGVPVYYATIGYETGEGDPPAHMAICWWGKMTFGPHFYALLGLPRARAAVRFGPAPIAGDDRKELARTLHEAIEAQFVPVVTEAVQ